MLLEQSDSLRKARSLSFRYLTYRARSISEISAYLESKGFSATVIASIVAELQEYGYLDDENFAIEFINYRKRRDFGLLKVRYDLISKGIEKKLVERLLIEHFCDEEDFERINNILNKRLQRGDFPDQRWIKRQLHFLKRRGFQDHLIYRAFKQNNFNNHNFSE